MVKPSKKKFGKKIWKQILEKHFKTKIFITKIYDNIDKCYTIFASLTPFDENRGKDRE